MPHAKTPKRKDSNVVEENSIATEIVDAALTVQRKFGPGLLETVYEAVLAHEIVRRGLRIERKNRFRLHMKTLFLTRDFVPI